MSGVAAAPVPVGATERRGDRAGAPPPIVWGRGRYRGDFDWGGVTIARTLASYVDWLPWRYDAQAYLKAVEGRGDSLPALSGTPQATAWDVRLAEVMRERGVSVEEEVVIDELVADLAAWASPR